MASAGSLTIPGNSVLSAYIGKLEYIQPRTSGGTISFTNLGGGTPWAIISSDGLTIAKIKPSADSTTAIRFMRADGVTACLTLDTLNGNLQTGGLEVFGKLIIHP